MDTRDAYKQKYEAQLKEWGSRIDVMTARTEKLAAQTRIDLAPHVEGVQQKYEAARGKLQHIADATEDRWGDVMKDADAAWQDLKSSAEGAFDALRSRDKS